MLLFLCITFVPEINKEERRDWLVDVLATAQGEQGANTTLRKGTY
jgi:hypothetical protein